MKTINSEKKIGLSLFLLVGIILSVMGFTSGAGFGSSYLPNNTLEIPIGSNSSYFIYPQNFDNETLLVKINITNGNNIVLNDLNSIYEIPPNTESDSYKIGIIIGLANETGLIGQKFPISYQVFSTFKTNETGIVTFNPIGYTKSFFVMGKDRILIIPIIPPVVNNTNQTPIIPPVINNPAIPNNNPVIIKQTPKKIDTPTPTPVLTDTPTPKIKSDTPVITEVVTQINYFLWFAIGIGFMIIAVTFIVIFSAIRKSQDEDYNNYNLNKNIS